MNDIENNDSNITNIIIYDNILEIKNNMKNLEQIIMTIQTDINLIKEEK